MPSQVRRLELLERKQRECEEWRAAVVTLDDIEQTVNGLVAAPPDGPLQKGLGLVLTAAWHEYEEGFHSAYTMELVPPRGYRRDLSDDRRVWRWRHWDSDQIRPLRTRLVEAYEAWVKASA